MTEALIQDDTVIAGLLMLILALVFKTSENSRFKTFYTFVPPLLLCYLLPSLLVTFKIVHAESNLYTVAKNYFLPASLALFCISIDFKGLQKLGNKAIIMFFAATIGIMLGGPVALWLMFQISPETLVVNGQDASEFWRGLTTVAGSWMGGGANQVAMKEVYEVGDDLYSVMVTVDIITANIWMAVLLYGAGISDKIDAWLGADNSAIKEVQERIESYQANLAKIPSLSDLTLVVAVGLGAMAFSQFGATYISPFLEDNASFLKEFGLTSTFFWVVVISTTVGMLLSLTKFRELEGVGASRVGSLFLYFLIATIGMKMNIFEIINSPMLLLLGIIWMLVHIIVLLVVARLIKAPFFFVAVGSQANVGGAASAPVVASAFRPSLSVVGVLLAVLGYAIGTYGAILTAYLMRWISL